MTCDVPILGYKNNLSILFQVVSTTNFSRKAYIVLIVACQHYLISYNDIQT